MKELRKKSFKNGVVYCLQLEDGFLVETTDTFLPYYTKDAIGRHQNKLDNNELGDRTERWMIGVSTMSGCPVRRKGWNGKGMFVVKQISCNVEGDVIPKMQSLPKQVKNILMKRKQPCINYTYQLLLVQKSGRADSWTASSSDIFADDWEIVMEE